MAGPTDRNRPRALYLAAHDSPFGIALRAALRRYGDVTSVGDVRHALTAIRARPHSGLVIDSHTDDQAFVVLTAFRKMYRVAPAIVLTESLDKNAVDCGCRLKAVCVLRPVNPEDIATFVGLASGERWEDEQGEPKPPHDLHDLPGHVSNAAVSRRATPHLPDGPQHRREVAHDPINLTIAEREVYRLMALGLPNWVIAQKLFVSVETVKTHVSHILSKLGVPSRKHVILAAQRHRNAFQ